MTEKHLYFYIENADLTEIQQKYLSSDIEKWGLRDKDPNPVNRNHWRIRQDGKAIIFEAWIDDKRFSDADMKTLVAASVATSVISVSTVKTKYDFWDLIEFVIDTKTKMRLGIFGGISADYKSSQVAVHKFLDIYSKDWNTQDIKQKQ